ncbi:MAG: ATP-binding protein [Candidatus Binatia bacterium]|nr:ATP-binding protein [Candidatus Binatia bacterium]
MTFLAVVTLLAAGSSLCLAVLVVSQRRDKTAKGFAFMALLVGAWNLHFFLLSTLPCESSSTELLNISRVGGLILPTAILSFVNDLRSRPLFWKSLVSLNVLGCVVLVAANPFGLVVRGLKYHHLGCYSLTGPLYHVYTANVALCFASALVLCAADLRGATNARERLVARFWLISGAVALPLGITNLFPAYEIPIYPLGNLGSAVWAGIIAYAIVRHRLLDVEIWISRLGTAFVAGLVTIVPAYILLVVLQIYTLGHAQIDVSSGIFLSLVFVALVFPALQRRLEQEFAKRAFPYKVEQHASLEMLRKAVLQEQNRERLLDIVARGLWAVFRPPAVAIFTRHPEAGVLRLAHHVGQEPAETTFPFSSALVAELEEASLSLLQSELAESKRPRAREVGELMQRLHWTACVPIKANRQLLGFLALGLKEGRDWYMLTELEALERLSDELALALDNIQLHEQAAFARQALERVERLSAIGTMVAGIVHEVRNPLVAFSTFMQLAREHKSSPEMIENSAPVIISELERVQRLLDELLHATRATPPRFGAVDLHKCVTDVADLLKPAAKQVRVLLQADAPPEPVTVFADADRVRQVLFNLGLNAIEASPSGSTVAFIVARETKNGRSYGEVRVRDTGPGLPKELREKVFQPFFTTKPDGTGLGLALCLQIAEDHGGYLEIREPEGRGVIFAAGFPEFIAEIHARLIEAGEPPEPKLTPEEEAHVRALVGNIKLPPEVLRLARQTRRKS